MNILNYFENFVKILPPSSSLYHAGSVYMVCKVSNTLMPRLAGKPNNAPWYVLSFIAIVAAALFIMDYYFQINVWNSINNITD